MLTSRQSFHGKQGNVLSTSFRRLRDCDLKRQKMHFYRRVEFPWKTAAAVVTRPNVATLLIVCHADELNRSSMGNYYYVLPSILVSTD